MEEEKWREVKRIFSAAVELSAAQKNQLLTEECGDDEIRREVENLLVADIEAGTLPDIFGAKNLTKPPPEKNIGKYKIVRELGVGGMGTVFLAVREDLKKEVALKIVKYEFASNDLLRRFENEREILAALEHPNIARLLDIGTTENGLPYFVMEYVEGADLLAFCRENNLSLAAKLNLFRKVCAAVSYAHGKLIVHRDLKPSNILVTRDGEPKLLDFGISKLLNENAPPEQKGTATALGMMTPNYASPEQFRGESVSTATDIYSLGVILYELLTNNLPYKVENRRLDEVARAICETDPQKPSDIVSGNWILTSETANSERKSTNGDKVNSKAKTQNSKLLRGDIDNIILKSLRKEPERRYSSVEKFSEDLRRHLDGLPVTARPDTFSYRAEKFIKRNRPAIGAGILILLILITGIIGVSWQYFRAERQRKLAEQRFGQIRELANNIVFKYYDEIEKFPDSTKLRETIVSDSLSYFDSLADDANADDTLKSELARAYIRIGKVQGRAYFANLGNTSGAIENYRKGINLLEPLATMSGDAKMQTDLINAYSEFSVALKRQGNAAESDAVLRRSIELNERLLQKNSNDIPLSIRLAASYIFLGDSLPVGSAENENIAAYRRSMSVSDEILQRDSNHIRANNLFAAAADRVATNLKSLAAIAEEDENIDAQRQLLAQSAPIAKRNVEIAEKMVVLEPDNILNFTVLDVAKANYGDYFFAAGDYVTALHWQIAALQNIRKTAEKDVNDLEQKQILAAAIAGLGATYSRLGNISKSEQLFSEAVGYSEELVAHDRQNFDYLQKRWEVKNFHADELVRRGEIGKARQIYKQAYPEIESAAREKDAAYGESLRGFYFYKLGNCDLAEAEDEDYSADKKAAKRQDAIDDYQKASELWAKSDVQAVLGVKQSNKLEVLQRKISRFRQTIKN